MAGLRELRVHTVELLRTPGLVRAYPAQIKPADLQITDPGLLQRVLGDVVVDLIVESTVDGLVVHGDVEISTTDDCRRCLRPVTASINVDVDEVFQPVEPGRSAPPEGINPLESEALDLSPVVRDAVLLALAGPPLLCDEACAGLCPVCGEDRNFVKCDCDYEVRDLRWSALDQLRDFSPD
jgi:uncharacterized protein